MSKRFNKGEKMSGCLGLYIENNIIKYAKVSKENNIIKIESFGTKILENLQKNIEQIIEETNSYKTPISINSTDENYNYFYLFNMLTQKDLNDMVKTEFEARCAEKELNIDTYESRYILVNDLEDKEKIKAIHISANKADLAKKITKLDKYRLTSITPLPISISNLLEFTSTENKENLMIVNIEETTTVTTIIEQKIYDIKKVEQGIGEIIKRVKEKEISELKAYEIVKNSTIYTNDSMDLEYEETNYLDEIMPTIYNIVGTLKKITNESVNKIDKIYITGTAALINNIDIYFQDYLEDIKCEILKPYFLRNMVGEINTKDYIEVNSAVALAMQGMNEGIKGINFQKEDWREKLPSWMTKEIGSNKKNKNKQNKKEKKADLNINLDSILSKTEIMLMHFMIPIVSILIIYIIVTTYLANKLNKDYEEAFSAELNVKEQITLVENDTEKVNKKTDEYEKMIQNFETQTQRAKDKSLAKYAIPNLLVRLSKTIPQDVQIMSIENTENKHIKIIAKSEVYDQLGIFLAKLKLTKGKDTILENVISDSAIREDKKIIITIEGDLP